MGFLEEAEKIRIQVGEALGKLGYYVEVRVEEPPIPELGDIATPVAFDLAKELRRKPSEIAEEIIREIDVSKLEVVHHVSNVNGFINFHMDPVKYPVAIINEVLSKRGDYGKIPIVRKRILIEHTNSNPNKALHIGTLRNAVIGDSLARFLKFLGHEVLVVNYIDDSGSQVADNTVAHYFMKVPTKPPEGLKFDEYSGKVYAEYNEKISRDEELKRLKSEVIRKIEEGGNEIAEFARRLSEEVVKCQLETAWDFGIFYDLLNWETDVIRSGIFQWAMKELEKRGEVYVEEEGVNKGCLMIKLRDVEEFKNLKAPDEVLIRSDGTATYVGKDIAYASWKLGLTPRKFKVKEWIQQPNGKTILTTHEYGEDYEFPGADIAITVVDKRQEYPQMVVKHALKKIGMPPSKEYHPYLYEVVALSGETASEMTSLEELKSRKVVHMSGRRGLVFNANDLLKTVFQKVYEETKKRHPEESEEWIRKVSMCLSTASVRYSLIKTDRNNLIVFDVKDAVRLEGDTGPYLQYTYARACRIIEKAGVDVDSVNEVSFETPEEQDLVKQIGKFSWVLNTASKTLAMNTIAVYMRHLADSFNSFYEKCPVITDGIRRDRFALVKSFLITMGNAFDIIGIEKLSII
ncbi:MAG: arginine--tRNA ligase [Candidatus Brockarchaeota archaeon]|nr:arginine--tRNA ligase [Candidatus Brockarchaeota archaeon]